MRALRPLPAPPLRSGLVLVLSQLSLLLVSGAACPALSVTPPPTPPGGLRYGKPPGWPPTPVGSAPPASTPGPATSPGPAATERAARLHGAVALGAWPRATQELAGLDPLLTAWLAQAPRTGPLRAELYAARGRLPALEAAVVERRQAAANQAAHQLLLGLLAIAEGRSRGGGGGGSPPAAAPAVVHLERGYTPAVAAHLALLESLPVTEVRPQLDTVRAALAAARAARPGQALATRLADLDRRRWRVVAALGTPARARTVSHELVVAYAEAMRVVGATRAPGR
ncbi:MAG: hypothetical protein VKQ33_05130 [Candidatus Sericytochromatia bacterium]|nr:hypothetical protein [Candidatus Sericytochromatia bacterium]